MSLFIKNWELLKKKIAEKFKTLLTTLVSLSASQG